MTSAEESSSQDQDPGWWGRQLRDAIVQDREAQNPDGER